MRWSSRVAGAAYGDRVHWVYKEYPLRRHKDAFKAAEASHCAQDQGKFWEYQEKLFTMPDLAPANLVSMAVQLGMSQEKFAQCLQGSSHKAEVDKNVRDAVEAGVDRTPSFMINGTLFAGGLSLDNFRGVIDEELKKSRGAADCREGQVVSIRKGFFSAPRNVVRGRKPILSENKRREVLVRCFRRD